MKNQFKYNKGILFGNTYVAITSIIYHKYDKISSTNTELHSYN